MITYNHEKFIRQALDSVLMQQVDFDYEVVIGEDRSTDSTRSILLEYQKKYPEKIRLLLHEKNLGGTKNFASTFQSCRGEYIAILEGDDYWLSSDKVQKQIDFLKARPEYVLCFHNVVAQFEDGRQQVWNRLFPHLKEFLDSAEKRRSFEISDLLKANFIPTGSVLFRGGLLRQLPEWISSLKLGDWPLFILLAQFGKIGFIDEIMGAYRIHHESLWFNACPIMRMEEGVKMFSLISRHFDFRYHKIIRRKIAFHYFDLAKAYWSQREWKKALARLFACFKVFLRT